MSLEVVVTERERLMEEAIEIPSVALKMQEGRNDSKNIGGFERLEKAVSPGTTCRNATRSTP